MFCTLLLSIDNSHPVGQKKIGLGRKVLETTSMEGADLSAREDKQCRTFMVWEIGTKGRYGICVGYGVYNTECSIIEYIMANR